MWTQGPREQTASAKALRQERPSPPLGMLRLDGAPQRWSGVPAGQRHLGVKTLHL